MAKEKIETVKALALQAGALWLNGIGRAFKEGDTLNWPADDAQRAQDNGVILIDQPTAKVK